MDNQKKPPVIPLDVADTDETREPTGEDLQYNDAKDSFELDPETADREYHHPQPYDTAAPEGEDDNSTYDEENPYTPNEYRDKKDEMKGELEELDTTVSDEELTRLSAVDEQLTNTPEDDWGDLDAEGYPRWDDAGGDNNPVLDVPADGDDPERPDEPGPPEDDGDESDPRVPPFDERDPLGDKQIQQDDPTETGG